MIAQCYFNRKNENDSSRLLQVAIGTTWRQWDYQQSLARHHNTVSFVLGFIVVVCENAQESILDLDANLKLAFLVGVR